VTPLLAGSCAERVLTQLAWAARAARRFTPLGGFAAADQTW